MERRSSKLFISYSRTDGAFVDQLDCGLRVAGYEPLIDRAALLKGEEWQSRLEAFIAEADTVIFVLTPAFAASEVCRWEVGRARALGKRLMPVLLEPVDNDAVPPDLARLNYVRFDTAPFFAHALKDLVEALDADIEWLRENTRILTLAQAWDSDGRPDSRLLRGADVAAGKALVETRPAAAPEQTRTQLDFIAASEAGELARSGAERQRLAEMAAAQDARAEALARLAWRTHFALGVVAVALAAILILAGYTWTQYREIKRAELRLREGLALIVADTDHTVASREMWYRVATDYKLALARMSVRDRAGVVVQKGTGFLMRGGDIAPRWAGRMVFVTAGHAIVPDGGGAGRMIGLTRQVEFPGLDQDAPVPLGHVLYFSDQGDDDFAVLAVDASLPDDAAPVPWDDAPAERGIDGIAVLHWDVDDGFSLGLGHALDRPGDQPVDPRRLYYTHVTGPGASGAPVFSLKTGRLLCLHQVGQLGDGRNWGRCTHFHLLPHAVTAQNPGAPDDREGTTGVDE